MRAFFHNRVMRDLWWVEALSGATMILWAVINLLSPESLSQKNFAPILSLGDEIFWEYMFLFFGACQLLATLYDSLSWRSLSAFFSAWLIGCVAANLLLTGHWPPGAVAYYILGSYSNILAGARDGYTWWSTS